LSELREFEESSCNITGCPCLLWTGMQLGSGPITSYDDATKCGIDSLLWLEICRWAVWIHLRRGLSNEDGNTLINARDQMLKINEEMKPGDRSKCFMHDLESFSTAVAKDIGSLAEQHDIDMSDDTIESKIEVFTKILNLEKCIVGKNLEWRAEEHDTVLVTVTKSQLANVTEADILNRQLLNRLIGTLRSGA
jgi:hypothetical protein